MKNIKKIIVIWLLLLIIILTGCRSGGDVTADTTMADTTAETPETVPEPTTVSLLGEDGKAAYRIVTPEERSDRVARAGIELSKALTELTDTKFSISADYLMHGESIEDMADVCEILIGETNRPESAQAYEGLSTNEYVIRIVGTKIVIAGGSDIVTYHAMNQFLNMIKEKPSFVLKKDMDIKQTIDIKIGSGSYLIGLTNQGESTLEVYDLSSGKLDKSTLVWSYKLSDRNITGTKFRHSDKYGNVALAVCGNGYGCMISYPGSELLWYTEAGAENPHSIELMPNGVVAIASSNGGEVRFFTTDEKYSVAPSASMILEDAHGVLWDEERQVLWAVGRNMLMAYRVTLNADGTVSVTEDNALCTTLPSDWAHDLAPVYGNTDALWIATGTHVYQFNKTSKTFSSDYAGHKSLDRKDIKGVGNFDDGSIVYIYPDGQFKSWTSCSIALWRDYEGVMASEVITSETGHFYKVRVWDSRYQ